MKRNLRRRSRTTKAATLLGLQCMAMASVHAAPACYVDAVAGVTPAGCMNTISWSGHGEFDPAIIKVVYGGQYARVGSGLSIYNSNEPPPGGGNSGTRGIYADGQSAASPPEPSRARTDGYTTITIEATSVYNPTSNEGVYASNGAQVQIGGGLSVTTSTTQPGTTARAVVAHGTGVGALATTPSGVTVDGALEVDTTQAAQTAFAVEATDGGAITIWGGGSLRSARSGIYVRAAGTGTLPSSVSMYGPPFTLQAGGNGVTLEGASSGNANVGTAQFSSAAITAHDSGVHLHHGNSSSSVMYYLQQSGSITSTHGSAIAFTGGAGTANVELGDVTVASQSPTLGGVDADSVPIGYAVVSTSGADNRLFMTGGRLNGPVVTDTGARLWLNPNDSTWNTGGDPGSATLNSLSGMSGTLTLRMDDINDRIELRGDAPSLGTGCGTATVTLQIPTSQPAPATSPHTLMLCGNIDAAPTVTLQGGSVVLGGFHYTLQVNTAGRSRAYQLVRGSAAADAGPGAGAKAIPTLSEWGLAMLSGLVGMAAFLRRRRSPGSRGA